ncbi:MAG: hypothetical protein IKU34_08260 [Clostridia bacterium]|nr:hypothetical protein [Clostridia bacterium]
MKVNSLRRRACAFGRSLIHPDAVRTNGDTSLLRLIAMITMVIDHFGKMCFPQIPEMRLIGRLAFPLFAYGIAVGAVYTKNGTKYLSRIVLLALISQPLYAVALAHEVPAMYAVPFSRDPLGCISAFYLGSWAKPNILFQLALGLCIILSLRNKQWALALGFYLLCLKMEYKLDYGIEGIHLMLLFYLLCEHPKIALAVWSAYLICWARGTGYTIFGMRFGMRIFALPSVILCALPMKRRFSLPRALTYSFYPAHLLVLMLVS